MNGNINMNKMKRLIFIFGLIFQISTIHSQGLYFPPVTGSVWDTISPQSLGWCQYKIDSLYQFLNNNNTKAFILLKNGKIVLEKYFGSFTQNSLWYWASAGKTITAFMTGIAQQENLLHIHDTSSQYLGQGWTNCTTLQEEKITIWHQLTMTSGLDDGVADHYCTLDTCLIYKADAGTRWAYHNGPYTILDSIIQIATSLPLNTYTDQKLKTPTGMNGAFLRIGYNNVFFSNARSMARFGLLILNKGNWNGNPIMTDTNYYNQMVHSSQNLNKSYGYLWWLNGQSHFMAPGSQFVFSGPIFQHAPLDAFAALGKNGQFLNVAPSQNLVWLRMGDTPDGLDVSFLLNDAIWEYLNDLACNSSINEEQEKFDFQLFPNPAHHTINIQSKYKIKSIEMHNISGQLIYAKQENQHTISISLNKFKPGIYYVTIHSDDDKHCIQKLIIY